jgi:hypothetical protein
MAGRLADAIATTLRTSGETLQRRTLLNVDRLDTQRVDIGAVVVLGVRDCRLDNLLDDLRALLGLKVRMLSACSTVLPRTRSATRRPFVPTGERRGEWLWFPSSFSLALGLLAGGVTLERTGEREFAELVTNHVFGNVHRNVLTAVMQRSSDQQNPAAPWSDATRS